MKQQHDRMRKAARDECMAPTELMWHQMRFPAHRAAEGGAVPPVAATLLVRAVSQQHHAGRAAVAAAFMLLGPAACCLLLRRAGRGRRTAECTSTLRAAPGAAASTRAASCVAELVEGLYLPSGASREAQGADASRGSP